MKFWQKLLVVAAVSDSSGEAEAAKKAADSAKAEAEKARCEIEKLRREKQTSDCSVGFAARREVWQKCKARYESTPVVNHEIGCGIWFTGGGVGFQINNDHNAPPLFLSRYAKLIITSYPSVLEWVSRNPGPTSSLERMIEWYKRLGHELMKEGWHILWRGVLLTSRPLDRVARDYQHLSESLKSDTSTWPPDSELAVFDIDDPSSERFATLAWADFVAGIDLSPFEESSEEVRSGVDAIRARFDALTALRSDGLISEDEYTAKRADILRDL